MGSVGSVSGTLQAMQSYSLEAVAWGEVTTQDVYLPDVPWVAQVTLNHFNNVTGSSAWIYEVDDTFYFMNCVYGTGQTRVTFALVSGYPPMTEGYGGSSCQALANIFLFSGDSSLVPTSPPPQEDYGGGGGDG